MKRNVFFILLLLTGTIMNAQWTEDTSINTLVANSEPVIAQSITASDGSTYVAFWKYVPEPTNLELRLQVIDPDGNQTLGENGVLISDEVPMLTYASIWDFVIDANDNLYIGVTGTANNAGYLFKVNMQGNSLWGLNKISNEGEGFKVTSLPLSNGETIVTWAPDGKLQMQKLDADGNPVWNNPIEIGINEKTAPGDLFELSDGSVEIVYHELLGAGVNSNLYVQRIGTDGTKIWENPVQLSTNQTVFNVSFSSGQDGDIVYYGHKAAIGSRFDSFLHRINPDGTLAWGINGMDFDTSNAYYEQETKIAVEQNGQYVWSISRYTDSSQGESGVYVQKFDKETGERQFTNSAKQIIPVEGNYSGQMGKLRLINNQPLFLILSGLNDQVIDITLLDENGDFVWENETEPIASAQEGYKSRINLGNVVDGQVVASFIQEVEDENRPFVQNFTSPDLVLSIKNENFEGFTYYPNPVENNLLLKANHTIKQITVYNLLGQKVMEETPNTMNTSIDMAQLNTGTYLMKVQVNGAKKTFKIIKR